MNFARNILPRDRLLNGLIGWWSFDDGRIQNYSGWDSGLQFNIGTALDAPFFPGFGPSMAFNFVSGGGVLYKANPYYNSLNYLGTTISMFFSLSYWIKLTANKWRIFTNCSSGGSANFSFGGGFTSNGKPDWWNLAGGPAFNADTAINDGLPHHIVHTRGLQGPFMTDKIYIDKNLDKSLVSDTGSGTIVTDTQIGINRFGAYSSDAYISTFSAYDIRFYNRELSVADVINLYNYPFRKTNSEMPMLTTVPSFIPAWAAQSTIPVIGAGTY